MSYTMVGGLAVPMRRVREGFGMASGAGTLAERGGARGDWDRVLEVLYRCYFPAQEARSWPARTRFWLVYASFGLETARFVGAGRCHQLQLGHQRVSEGRPVATRCAPLCRVGACAAQHHHMTLGPSLWTVAKL